MIFRRITRLIKVASNSHILKTGQTTLDCCKAHNVDKACLGLCTLDQKTMTMSFNEKRNTICTRYQEVIDLCFQEANPGTKGF